MKLFKIPFIGRGGIVLASGGEGITAFRGRLGIRLIPGANRKKNMTFGMRLQEWRNLILRGDRYNFGIVGRRCVTTAGVNYLRDCFAADNLGERSIVWHEAGTGTAMEGVGNTHLQTPWLPDEKVVGTKDISEAATFTSVATITFDLAKAITEHGIFSDLEDEILWDRTVFAEVNVVPQDSIEFTYSLLMAGV